LVEKPMALTSQDAWAMVKAAEQAGRVLMVGYPNRCEGIWQTVKRFLLEGAIGQIRQINLALCEYRRWFWEAEATPADVTELLRKYSGMPDGFFAGWQEWHRTPAQMGGGMFADTGTHWVDLMLWLAGAPPAKVVAFTESAGLPVECFINVQARLTNGVLLSLTSADAVPQGLLDGTRHLMIVGEKGILTSDLEGQVWLHQAGQEQKIEADVPDTTTAAAFVAAVMEGGVNLAPAREGVHAVAFIEAAYRSAAEGQIVQIE
jgi:predicted dehydrogenase